MSTEAAADQLLEGLNEPQREAVLHAEAAVDPRGRRLGQGRACSRTGSPTWSAPARRGPARSSRSFTNKAARCAAGGGARGPARTRSVGDDLPLRLHAHAAGRRRAPRLHPRLHDPDEQDSLRLVKNCVEELDVDRRFAPRASGARSRRRTSCSTPRPTSSRWRASSSRPPPTSTGSTSSACTAPTRWTSTTCCSAA